MIPQPHSRYLLVEGEASFTTLHLPDPAIRSAGAVLLCPPFGWEEICAYRALREWALELAAAGHPTLRITYPSTGDSVGNVGDPDRLGAWTAAVSAAARDLRATGGAARVTAVGIGLGGLLAHLAVVGGAPVDDLVLWGVPARGRSLVRQLRAFARLEASIFFEDLPVPEPLPEGELEAGGFRLSAETVTSLAAVDLTSAPLPANGDRRVLLLQRDGIAADADLVEAMKGGGAAVTTAPGSGYFAMTSHPQRTEAPREVFATVRRWLDAVAVPAPSLAVPVPRTPGVATIADTVLTAAGTVRETPIVIPHRGQSLSAVLVTPETEAHAEIAVVLLNAGAVRRVGPNRMWVEAARRWARRGVPVLRLDVAGIGDSDGDASRYARDAGLYAPGLVPQVLAALDALERSRVAHRFVVGGLCAGAYWAFHAALQDDRVVSAVMINPAALIWNEDLGAARDLRALVNQPFSLARLRRAATPERRRAVARWLLGTPRRLRDRVSARGRAGTGCDADIDVSIDRFLHSGKRALMLFSDHEPLETELTRSGRMGRLRGAETVALEQIAVRDHTLRPAWAQARAHEALDRALERELAAVLSA